MGLLTRTRRTLDPLSEVLRGVRLEGAFYFAVDGSARRLDEAHDAEDAEEAIAPGADEVATMFVVASGTCVFTPVGEAPVAVGPGHVVVFPRGGAGALSRARLEASNATPARVVVALIGYDPLALHPLVASLPRVMCLRLGASEHDTLEPLLRLAVLESKAPRSGSSSVLSRLSELILVEIARSHVATQPPENARWLAGLRDDVVARALAQLHARPTHDWSLDALARTVGCSRTVVADRFAHVVGVPPMQYLARFRMHRAAALLESGTASLAEVASRVGYGSDAAFSRAFKRVVGVSPAQYRRATRTRATGASATTAV